MANLKEQVDVAGEKVLAMRTWTAEMSPDPLMVLGTELSQCKGQVLKCGFG